VQRIGELLRQLARNRRDSFDRRTEHAFLPWLASHAHCHHKGQIVYTATIEDLKANDNIRQRYLAL